MATQSRNESSARVFISYARADGEAYARYLHDKLTAEGITCWWDREDLRRTSNWWRKIDQALESVEYLVAVLTPEILNSETCRKEWQWARRKGRCIVPVKAGMSFEAPTVPRWLKRGHAYQALDLQQKNPSPGSEWQKFINDLNTTPKVEKVPFMTGDLPEDFVARPEEFNKLLAMLIDTERSEPVAITAALRGAGGYGKTTLAKALCHDLRVQEAFDDGILWVTLGEKAENLTGNIRDCIQALAGERPDFAGASEAAVKLAELLDGRDVLMVIDDVWKRSHLEPFVQGGDRCARLITTRITDVLPKATRKLNVDAMKKSEAMALLEAGLPKGDQRALADLVGKLGEWPLLIKLVNRVLFDRVEQGQQIDAALTFAAEKLNRQGLTAFDAGDADQRNDAVSKTIGVSLELLNSTTELPRLLELGIFPEDEDIPLDTVASLWQRTGEVDSFKSEELCERFFKLSLVLELDLGPRTVRLHDALRSFFISRLKDSRLVHDQLVETWPDPHKLPNKYAWKWYGWHVLKSSHPERLLNLLSDFNWLYAKLDATDVDSLLSEFTYATNQSDCLRLIGSAIALSAHVLAKDKTQVASQLVGRLPKALGNEIDRLQEAAARYNETAWIEPLKGSLQAPGGAILGTREGPFNSAKAIALTLNDILVVSHLKDDTLNVWKLSSGRTLCTLDDGVDLFIKPCVALSSDGRFAVSAVFTKALKLWELQSGKCLRILKGHSGIVEAIAISRNGRMAVSASDDRTLKLWDIQSGNCLRTLDVHSTHVSAVTVSADGRFSLTGSQEGDINVWDFQSGDCLSILKGHSDSVSAIAISPDGRMAVSGSNDKTLIVWDVQSGDCLSILKGHSGPVNAIAISSDGLFAVSASDDRTLKFWTLHSGDSTRSRNGHSKLVTAIAITPDFRFAVSGSYDNTLKIWDLQSGDCLQTLDAHCIWVTSVALSPDGRTAISASYDNTLEIWDLQSGDCLRTLKGHSGSVFAVALSPDGRTAISASYDNTLEIWDLQSGDCLRTLKGHFGSVFSVALSPDGLFAVSASDDRTLKIWNLQSSDCLRTLKGHSGSVFAVALSPDGRTAISASYDNTLKIWDLQSGDCLRTLKGHSGSVFAVATSSDGLFAVSGSKDKTLKVWDLNSYDLRATFFADAPISSLAVGTINSIVAGDENGQVHFLKVRLPSESANR